MERDIERRGCVGPDIRVVGGRALREKMAGLVAVSATFGGRRARPTSGGAYGSELRRDRGAGIRSGHLERVWSIS